MSPCLRPSQTTLARSFFSGMTFVSLPLSVSLLADARLARDVSLVPDVSLAPDVAAARVVVAKPAATASAIRQLTDMNADMNGDLLIACPC